MPTNLKICLETIKEVSNLSILPKGVVDMVLKELGIIKDKLNGVGPKTSTVNIF